MFCHGGCSKVLSENFKVYRGKYYCGDECIKAGNPPVPPVFCDRASCRGKVRGKVESTIIVRSKGMEDLKADLCAGCTNDWAEHSSTLLYAAMISFLGAHAPSEPEGAGVTFDPRPGAPPGDVAIDPGIPKPLARQACLGCEADEVPIVEGYCSDVCEAKHKSVSIDEMTVTADSGDVTMDTRLGTIHVANGGAVVLEDEEDSDIKRVVAQYEAERKEESANYAE